VSELVRGCNLKSAINAFKLQVRLKQPWDERMGWEEEREVKISIEGDFSAVTDAAKCFGKDLLHHGHCNLEKCIFQK
jgi:hypothetical protein